MRITKLTLSLALALIAAPMLTHAIEEPAYEITRRIGDVEVRQYASYVVAEVLVAGSATEAGDKAFPILAGYIFGKNKGEKKLSMTAPVTQTAAPMKLEMTAPVTQSAAPGGCEFRLLVTIFHLIASMTQLNEKSPRIEIVEDLSACCLKGLERELPLAAT
jgi:hypothetical protein